MRLPTILIDSFGSLAQVWEQSVIRTWMNGINIKTQYDRPGEPPSKACMMIMEIRDPLMEPRIHRCMPAGLGDLEVYKQEVIDGIHDSWIDHSDPKKWQYTYHERLMTYKTEDCGELYTTNQITYIVDNLAACFFSRRAQAITWQPDFDPRHTDPPCLQRIWGQIMEEDNKLYFTMHAFWRSRDAFKAAYMNMFAFIELQKVIAKRIGDKIGREVLLGSYVDVSDNYHIYGTYYKEVDDFIKTLDKRTFEERTYTTEFAEEFFVETREKLLKEV